MTLSSLEKPQSAVPKHGPVVLLLNKILLSLKYFNPCVSSQLVEEFPSGMLINKAEMKGSFYSKLDGTVWLMVCMFILERSWDASHWRHHLNLIVLESACMVTVSVNRSANPSLDLSTHPVWLCIKGWISDSRSFPSRSTGEGKRENREILGVSENSLLRPVVKNFVLLSSVSSSSF